MMGRPALLALALTVLLVAGAPVAAAESSTSNESAVLADVSWVLQTVRPDGAIATNPDQLLVWPYLANYAAAGLARGAAAGDAGAAEAAWAWVEWYQAHQDGNGYVTDYEVGPNGLASTGTMDSTDAYAGTYLVAVRDVALATGDLARLDGLRAGVDGAVRAIESTQDADGLTAALPSWPVKYLMDNAETYGGLVAAAEIGQLLGDSALSARAGADADLLRAGVAQLWNPATESYDWAVHEDGVHHVTDWSVLYPDATQQLWAVAWGLVDGPTATALLDRFEAAQPSWADPNEAALTDAGVRKVGYWAIGCWALQRVGRDASAAIASIRSAAMASGQGWPYTSATQGQLMVAAAPGLPSVASVLAARQSASASLAQAPEPSPAGAPTASAAVSTTASAAPARSHLVDGERGPRPTASSGRVSHAGSALDSSSRIVLITCLPLAAVLVMLIVRLRWRGPRGGAPPLLTPLQRGPVAT